MRPEVQFLDYTFFVHRIGVQIVGQYIILCSCYSRRYTELYDHLITSVWRLFRQEVAARVYYLTGPDGSCSSAKQPNGKSESSITETY